MKKLVFLLLFTLPSVLFAQTTRSISGVIKDDSGNPAPYMSVLLEGSVLGTNSNENGEFELSGIKPGKYTLRISGVGFTTVRQPVDLTEQDVTGLQFTVETASGLLGEVVVSAGRTVEALDETPSSVHVVDSKFIQNQMKVSPNIANILAASVPGLALSTNTTGNAGQTLRGRNVLVMIDGIPQSTPLRAGGRDIRTIDPEAIERVEVVKGATAIYGNGADGGLINYITKKADATKPFSASTSIYNTGMLAHSSNTFGGRISQQFSGKLNAFDYLVSGAYEKTGVYKDADGVAISPTYGLGESNIYNGFAKLGYDINSAHRIELTYNYFGSQQNSDYVEQLGKYLETPTIGVKGDRKGVKEGTKYNHNAQLKYFGNNIFGQTDIEASVYTQQFHTIYVYTSSPTFEGQSVLRSDKKGSRLSLITPFQLGASISGNVVYGVDYLNDETSQGLVDGRTWVPEIELKNSAPYAQAQLNFFDDFILKGGIRYDNVSVTVPDFTQLLAPNGTGGKFINGGEIDFDAFTFNTGLRYAKLDAFKPYVSFSQGFSIIDVGRFVRSAKENDIAKMDIDPVIVNSYEAGFHSKVGIVSFSGAYFVSTSKLGSSLQANADNTIYSIQRAPERVYGFEAVVDVFISKRLQWGASGAYAEGKADIDDNGSFSNETDKYLNGTRISPPKITSYVDYRPIDKLSLNLQWIYSGERKRFDPNPSTGRYMVAEGPVSSFSVFNFTAGYQFTDKISASLGIENLLNETYFLPVAYWNARDEDYMHANGARYQLGVSIKW